MWTCLYCIYCVHVVCIWLSTDICISWSIRWLPQEIGGYPIIMQMGPFSFIMQKQCIQQMYCLLSMGNKRNIEWTRIKWKIDSNELFLCTDSKESINNNLVKMWLFLLLIGLWQKNKKKIMKFRYHEILLIIFRFELTHSVHCNMIIHACKFLFLFLNFIIDEKRCKKNPFTLIHLDTFGTRKKWMPF